MKLAFVTPWYGMFAGGAEVTVREIAENLAKMGIEVEVLTTCVKTPFDNWWKNEYSSGQYKVNGVIVRRFPVNAGNEPMYHEINHKIITGERVTRDEELRYLKGSICSDSLCDYISKNKDSYVFALMPYLYGLTYWAYQAAPKRCILIPCLHDEPQAYFSTSGEILQSKKVLFLSQEEMSLAMNIHGMNGDNFELIGDGVKHHGSFHPDLFKAKYQIEGPYLLSVGRKDIGKNIHKLIEYFDYYKKSCNDDLKLVFIGGGDDSLIPKRDYFIDLGFIDEEDKQNAYAGAIATCQLSANESFSLVIMESWQASRPVIVNDGCAVTKGHCLRSNGGLFVANMEEFAETIRFLRENPVIASCMGINGRKYVLDNFMWDKITQKYINVFNEFEDKADENIN